MEWALLSRPCRLFYRTVLMEWALCSRLSVCSIEQSLMGYGTSDIWGNRSGRMRKKTFISSLARFSGNRNGGGRSWLVRRRVLGARAAPFFVLAAGWSEVPVTASARKYSTHRHQMRHAVSAIVLRLVIRIQLLQNACLFCVGRWQQRRVEIPEAHVSVKTSDSKIFTAIAGVRWTWWSRSMWRSKSDLDLNVDPPRAALLHRLPVDDHDLYSAFIATLRPNSTFMNIEYTSNITRTEVLTVTFVPLLRCPPFSYTNRVHAT